MLIGYSEQKYEVFTREQALSLSRFFKSRGINPAKSAFWVVSTEDVNFTPLGFDTLRYAVKVAENLG